MTTKAFGSLVRDSAAAGDAMYRRATDVEYWSALFSPPQSPRFIPNDEDESSLNDEVVATLRSQVVVDGFFRTGPVLAPSLVNEALRAVEIVEGAGWPPVFAFFSDAVWNLLASPAYVALIHGVGGTQTRQLPGLWAKRVSRGGGAGWSPHVDKSGPHRNAKDGAPVRLSIWIPLTDVTLENGCMHVVPDSVMPQLSRDFDTRKEMSTDDVIRLLHGARALPAPAGSILAWRETTLHWGGPSTGAAPVDRVSISLEVGRVDVDLQQHERPAFPLGTRPDFESRVRLIGRSLVLFGSAADREPEAFRFVGLGERMTP